jgi:N6-adenosine-specific RNA methylase IME4
MTYSCIIADPAWRYDDKLSAMKCTGQRGVADRYKTTMTVDEICRLAVHGPLHSRCDANDGGCPACNEELPWLTIMGQPIAADAHLWLWITNPGLCAGWHIPVLRAWGFTAKTVATWIKGRIKVVTLDGDLEWDTDLVMDEDYPVAPELVQHFAQGRYLRGTTEHCILAVRGRCPALVHDLPSAFVYPGRWPGRLHSEKPPIIHEWAERLSPGPRVELFARRARPGWDAVGDELPVDASRIIDVPTEGR